MRSKYRIDKLEKDFKSLLNMIKIPSKVEIIKKPTFEVLYSFTTDYFLRILYVHNEEIRECTIKLADIGTLDDYRANILSENDNYIIVEVRSSFGDKKFIYEIDKKNYLYRDITNIWRMLKNHDKD